MRRRSIAAVLTGLLTTLGCGGQPGRPAATAPAADAAPFTIVETDIATLQQALQSGRLTSRQLTERYLERIATYEDRLNAIITVNPRALAEADAMDQERAAGRVRGPLHGIPIALKDNVHTTDIRTTGGALAFRDLVPPYDATLTRNLRDGGAIIIAKTVLTELAHWTAGAPTPMVANYTGVAGFAYNPYDPRMDPRDETFDGRPVLSTGGSSSGAGTAASFWAASVGSDTGGSIISPSNANMLVGIRPTIGRISRYGVIPDHRRSRHRRPDGPHGARRRGADGRARERGAGSERRRHHGVHAAAQPRLHRVPRRRRAQGRAHRRAAGVLHRRGDRPGREDAARRAQPRSGQGDGRGDRAAEGAGRRGRRSGRRAEHRRDRPGRQLPALRLLPGRRAQEGRRRHLHGELQVRDEARLQRLAGQPRRRPRR